MITQFKLFESFRPTVGEYHIIFMNDLCVGKVLSVGNEAWHVYEYDIRSDGRVYWSFFKSVQTLNQAKEITKKSPKDFKIQHTIEVEYNIVHIDPNSVEYGKVEPCKNSFDLGKANTHPKKATLEQIKLYNTLCSANKFDM